MAIAVTAQPIRTQQGGPQLLPGPRAGRVPDLCVPRLPLGLQSPPALYLNQPGWPQEQQGHGLAGGSGTEPGRSVQRRPEETIAGGSQQLLAGGSWIVATRFPGPSLAGPTPNLLEAHPLPSPIPNPKDARQEGPQQAGLGENETDNSLRPTFNQRHRPQRERGLGVAPV